MAPKGKPVDTGLRSVVVSVSKSHSGQMWEEARKRPKAVLSEWLKEEVQVAPPFEMRNPRIIGGNNLKCVVEVRKGRKGKNVPSDWQECSARQRMVRETVLLPLKQDLASALRSAQGMGSTAWGVQLCGKGLAVRLKAEDYSSAFENAQQEQESAKFEGKRWEIAKLPLSRWKSEHVAGVLDGIRSVTPLYSTLYGMTRTCAVAAKTIPS